MKYLIIALFLIGCSNTEEHRIQERKTLIHPDSMRNGFSGLHIKTVIFPSTFYVNDTVMYIRDSTGTYEYRLRGHYWYSLGRNKAIINTEK